MKMKKVTDESFRKYGRVLDLDVSDLLKRLKETPLPEDVIYVASDQGLEACAEFPVIQDSVFGGMPIQIGYCNGNNYVLDAVEYHRDSELNIPLTGAVFMLGLVQDIESGFRYDTGKIEIFAAPAGAVLEFYGTTLHYAPCNWLKDGFRVAVILPRGTNCTAPQLSGNFPEDCLLTAKNKWLIAHPDSGLKANGAFIGLYGENLHYHKEEN